LSKHPCSVTRPRSRYAFCEPFRLFMYARATRPPGDDATLSSAADTQDDYWPCRSTRGEGSPVSWWGRNGYEGFVLVHTVGCWVGSGKGRRSRTMFSRALVLWRRPRRAHRQPRARVCTRVVFAARRSGDGPRVVDTAASRLEEHAKQERDAQPYYYDVGGDSIAML
jgi:hypothetical protein